MEGNNIENKLIDVTFLGNIFIFNNNLYDSSKKFFIKHPIFNSRKKSLQPILTVRF